MLFDRRYEIDPDGISVRARISPGRIPWQSFRWVRVVASTGAASPRITFWLASRRGGIALTVDASAGAEAADRVVSAVARYAPGLRRKGFTDCVKWDRAGPVDGEFVFQDDSFGELGIMFAFAGAMAAVSMQLAPLLVRKSSLPRSSARRWASPTSSWLSSTSRLRIGWCLRTLDPNLAGFHRAQGLSLGSEEPR